MAQQPFVESGAGKAPDYRLSFESAKTLFANLTPVRLELLDTLRRIGLCTPVALARDLLTADSDIQREIARLEFLGLVERDEAGDLTVPYEAVEIILPLAQVASSALRRAPSAFALRCERSGFCIRGESPISRQQ